MEVKKLLHLRKLYAYIIQCVRHKNSRASDRKERETGFSDIENLRRITSARPTSRVPADISRIPQPIFPGNVPMSLQPKIRVSCLHIVISFRKSGAAMNVSAFPGRFFGSQIQRLLAISLIMLSWSISAFCGEIHDAVEAGNLEKARALLQEKRELVSIKDSVGKTPLHCAAANGHKDIAELLLARDAEINARDGNGTTPLFLAVQNGYRDVVEVLLANKADVNTANNNGGTPLHRVAFNGDKDMAELLLAKGANTNAKNKRLGQTPLHVAARFDHKDIAELLLAKGADINARNNDDRTPLHWAAENGQKDVVELLLAKGAEVNASDNKGETPLHLAVNRGFTDIAELLRQHGGHEVDRNPLDLARGLLAYYPFNGNANDESGNGNNGVVKGAAPTADRFGVSGKAYFFNGTGYIDFGNSIQLGQPHTAFTITLWFKGLTPGPIFGDYEGTATGGDDIFAAAISIDNNAAHSSLPNYLSAGSRHSPHHPLDYTLYVGDKVILDLKQA
jgi:ankyrin repeat protein